MLNKNQKFASQNLKFFNFYFTVPGDKYKELMAKDPRNFISTASSTVGNVQPFGTNDS